MAQANNNSWMCFFIVVSSGHQHHIRDSIVASIPACHAGDRGSIPRRGETDVYFC